MRTDSESSYAATASRIVTAPSARGIVSDPTLHADIMRALAEERRRTSEEAVRMVTVHEDRLKHTSHRDGLGMGWQAGEELCRDIVQRLVDLRDRPHPRGATR